MCILYKIVSLFHHFYLYPYQFKYLPNTCKDKGVYRLVCTHFFPLETSLILASPLHTGYMSNISYIIYLQGQTVCHVCLDNLEWLKAK